MGKNGVLTVGDTSGFTESGGSINFLMEDSKVRFDINLTASEKAGLKIRSQLLRLAKKVVKDVEDVTSHNNAVLTPCPEESNLLKTAGKRPIAETTI